MSEPLLQRISRAAGNLVRLVRRSLENPAVPLTDAEEWDAAAGGARSTSGQRVTRLSALRYPAVWRAVNLISEDVAKLPLFVYRRLEPSGKERALEHPAYRLLRRKPNRHMTAKTFRATLTAHALLQGNGYAWIERDGAARPLALWPLLPEDTWPVRVNGQLWYHHPTGPISAENLLHIKGLGYDGLIGYSRLQLARDSLGLGLAAANYGARFFANDATPRVIFEFPGKMTPDAQEEFKRAWSAMHAGAANHHRAAVITGGAKMSKLSIDARDAQLLETRQFEIREVANWFGVPPHKLGDSSRTAYNTLEQENQSYLDDALDPWLVEWEEECFDKLLSEQEKESESHLIEFQRLALVRANLAQRYQAYNLALNGGWMSRDEVRERENLNPIPDGQGQQFLVALNMGNAGGNPATSAKPTPAADPATDGGNTDPPADQAARSATAPPEIAALTRRCLEEAAARCYRRLATHAGRAARKPAEFCRWLDRLDDDQADALAAILEAPLAAARAAAGLEPVPASTLAAAIVNAYAAELLALAGRTTAEELPAAVDAFAAAETATRPAAIDAAHAIYP